ncbi:Hypothetical protein P9515_12761 [Prochlorococcus marinus str. MIT 9515]|uniref:Uncharacterized protein n=1 Tax=Prochlorococcus marinus (strain MIT 9515) TaxID=167542 RepID=A2BXH2_PROM5|nr:hypothetical protein [Prochlorococcus marinus]ABM72483.1 Hypothetical protein P9515_12761 [Prochlorococcus marinus str. MIT 9515]
METFRFLLFGIAGLSVIFWTAIITLWHTYMFPTFFNEDKTFNSAITQNNPIASEPILGNLVNSNNFISREKYSMKNLVIADFSSTENSFKLNKLYTTVMIGVSFATFIFLTYGLSSSITTVS